MSKVLKFRTYQCRHEKMKRFVVICSVAFRRFPEIKQVQKLQDDDAELLGLEHLLRKPQWKRFLQNRDNGTLLAFLWLFKGQHWRIWQANCLSLDAVIQIDCKTTFERYLLQVSIFISPPIQRRARKIGKKIAHIYCFYHKERS